MLRSNLIFKIINSSFLIFGTAVGAGMLGLPIVISVLGFIPGVIISFLVWGLMYVTGVLFVDVITRFPNKNLLSIISDRLGGNWALITRIAFIFLYYVLIIAYFSAGSPVLINFLCITTSLNWVIYVIFGVVFSILLMLKTKHLGYINTILGIVMIICFFLLCYTAFSKIELEKLSFMNYSGMLLSAPVLFSVFGYHAVLPIVCEYLQYDKKLIYNTIFYGTFVALIMYVIWQMIMIGVISKDTLNQALLNDLAITDILHFMGNSSYVVVAQVFSFLALSTSLIGISLANMALIDDILVITWNLHSMKVFRIIIVLVPACIISAINPYIFNKALELAGGIGVSYLSGLLPLLLFYNVKYKKQTALELESTKYLKLLIYFMTACVISVMLLELYKIIKIIAY
ncbi:aromatic amino acid transport family protein [Rickettsia endosymbiont of Cardiosporidium cionae]|uniref:aromatic amino acid transport family protein n=1 Tax=Rickettsia endosymbiont of Cardiosporidium cionae TaxID=2777155 RepID=UPI00189518D0|nr:aromatic amino acid transport family protein [Rickettsia endosymbiont of Cardiosporidium cionae]KAF8818173.1 amino acid permease [Rickettsia endosymbiont of Cardiosporidium cionae]